MAATGRSRSRPKHLKRETEKLLKDVEVLERGLLLHQLQKDKDESSVRGMIRKELGSSVWHHGGPGRVKTYKSSRDLKDPYRLDITKLQDEHRKIPEKWVEVEGQSESSEMKCYPPVGGTIKNNTYIIENKCSNREFCDTATVKNEVKVETATEWVTQNGQSEAVPYSVATDTNKLENQQMLSKLKENVIKKASVGVIKRKQKELRDCREDSSCCGSVEKRLEEHLLWNSSAVKQKNACSLNAKVQVKSDKQSFKSDNQVKIKEDCDMPTERKNEQMLGKTFLLDNSEKIVRSKSAGFGTSAKTLANKNKRTSAKKNLSMKPPAYSVMKKMTKDNSKVEEGSRKEGDAVRLHRHENDLNATGIKNDLNSECHDIDSLQSVWPFEHDYKLISEKHSDSVMHREKDSDMQSSNSVISTEVLTSFGINSGHREDKADYESFPGNERSAEFTDGSSQKKLQKEVLVSFAEPTDYDQQISEVKDDKHVVESFGEPSYTSSQPDGCSIVVSNIATDTEQTPVCVLDEYIHETSVGQPSSCGSSQMFSNSDMTRDDQMHVQTWLKSLALNESEKYLKLFQEKNIKMADVRNLSALKLYQIGITCLVAIDKILNGVKDVDEEMGVRNASILSSELHLQSTHGVDESRSSKANLDYLLDGDFKDDLFKTRVIKKPGNFQNGIGTESCSTNLNDPVRSYDDKVSAISRPVGAVRGSKIGQEETMSLNVNRPVTKKQKKSAEKIRKKAVAGVKAAAQKFHDRQKKIGSEESNSQIPPERLKHHRDQLAARHMERERQKQISSWTQEQEEIDMTQEQEETDKRQAVVDNDISLDLASFTSINNHSPFEVISINIVPSVQSALESPDNFSDRKTEIRQSTEERAGATKQSLSRRLRNENRKKDTSFRTGFSMDSPIAAVSPDLSSSKVAKVISQVENLNIQAVVGNSVSLDYIRNLKKQLGEIEQHIVENDHSVCKVITPDSFVKGKRRSPNSEQIVDSRPQNSLDGRGHLTLPVNKVKITHEDIDFCDDDLIGEGPFSHVFKGKFNGCDVAVKQLCVPLLARDKHYFAAEVSLLQELSHPKMVQLIGICTSMKLPILILEYMPGGNLYDHLHDDHKRPLDHVEYYQIARDISQGMNYLHIHRPSILHLDLKSRNILIGSNGQTKIADFGFSKLRHEAMQRLSQCGKVKHHGSPVWTAPELLEKGEITGKADVYSFGIILWEMLTKEHPYNGCSIFQILERVRKNQRPEMPSDCPQELAVLIQTCWNQKTARRPSFKKVLSTLEKLTFPSEWRALFQEACVPTEVLEDLQSARSIVRFVSDTLSLSKANNTKNFDPNIEEAHIKTLQHSILHLPLETIELNIGMSLEERVETVSPKFTRANYLKTVKADLSDVTTEIQKHSSCDETNHRILSETSDNSNMNTERSESNSSDLVTVTDSLELSFGRESDLENSDSDEQSMFDSLDDLNKVCKNVSNRKSTCLPTKEIHSSRTARIEAWSKETSIIADSNPNFHENCEDVSHYPKSTLNVQSQHHKESGLKSNKTSGNPVSMDNRKSTLNDLSDLHISHKTRLVNTSVPTPPPIPVSLPKTRCAMPNLNVGKVQLLPGNKNTKIPSKSTKSPRKKTVTEKQLSAFMVQSSDLRSCKQNLQPITNPHPNQLVDLRTVQQEMLSSIADIIKKAVSKRRFAVDGEDSMQNSFSSLTWSIQE